MRESEYRKPVNGLLPRNHDCRRFFTKIQAFETGLRADYQLRGKWLAVVDQAGCVFTGIGEDHIGACAFEGKE